MHLPEAVQLLEAAGAEVRNTSIGNRRGDEAMENHTLRHCRDVWYPDLINREEYSQWAARGARPLREVLRERVRWIPQKHRPEPLNDDVEERIEFILRRAEKSVKSVR